MKSQTEPIIWKNTWVVDPVLLLVPFSVLAGSPFSNLSPLYKVVVREVLLMISSPEHISLGIKLHMHLI